MAQICFQNKRTNNYATLGFSLHPGTSCVLQSKGTVDTVPTVHVKILKQIYDRVLHRYIPNTWFADYVSSRDTNVIEVDDSGI